MPAKPTEGDVCITLAFLFWTYFHLMPSFLELEVEKSDAGHSEWFLL